MYCEKCNIKCPSDSAFCPNCGAPMEKKRERSQKAVSGEAGKKKRRGVKIFGLICVCLVVFCLLGYGVLWHFATRGAVTKYTYGSNGFLQTGTLYNKNGDILERYEYTCDSDGNILTEITHYSDGTLGRECTFDSEGNLLTKTSYDSNGYIENEESYVYEYTYDNTGNVLVEKCFYQNGYMMHLYEYAYDTEGNVLTRTAYDSDGVIQNLARYSYDFDGKLLSISDDSWVSKYIYDANDDLKKLEIYCTGHDYPENWYEYRYDDSGNKETETYYVGHGGENFSERIQTIISWLQWTFFE